MRLVPTTATTVSFKPGGADTAPNRGLHRLFNHRRLHGEIGVIPPVEFEERHYRHNPVATTVAAVERSLLNRARDEHETIQRPNGGAVDEDDIADELDGFIDQLLGEGIVPNVPTFLGEHWEPLAELVAGLLVRFEHTMVLEATRPDGTECYIQFARDDQNVEAELVSNEFLEGQRLPADRISLLLELGWQAPAAELSPNFSRTFTDPNPYQLAWLALQTLHDVYGAEPDDTWAVMPPQLLDGAGTYDDPALPTEPGDEGFFPDEGPESAVTGTTLATEGTAVPGGTDPTGEVIDAGIQKTFQMPKAVTIIGRSSSITNSFVNSIIPVIKPTRNEIKQALEILGMTQAVTCSYCGDPWTEWDHLRPIVIDRAPTGYISEIHNLVPACGKCNQSKGNRPWRQWMQGDAAKSPKTRGIADLDERVSRLDAYEQWRLPTKLDFAGIVGAESWRTYWERWRALLEQMRLATELASEIRTQVASAYEEEDAASASASAGLSGLEEVGEGVATPADGWTVIGPQGTLGPIPKNRAVLEAVRGYVLAGGSPESIRPLLGVTHFRSVAGALDGDELWKAFSEIHAKGGKDRRLWFLDAPIHSGAKTWVLANNVWGPRTHWLLKDLVTSSGGAIMIIAPNGHKVRRHDTGEGMEVVKSGAPIPSKRPLPARSNPPCEEVAALNQGEPLPAQTGSRDGSQVEGWSIEARRAVQRLSLVDPSWRDVRGPVPGFGAATVSIALALVEQGLKVRPLDDDDLKDETLADMGPAALLASDGQRRIVAMTNDFDQADPTLWARLKERVGPFLESIELDRALAEFCVHGPFERQVIRRNGQVWVTVMVRLNDVATALMDLTNVTRGLHSVLQPLEGQSNAEG